MANVAPTGASCRPGGAATAGFWRPTACNVVSEHSTTQEVTARCPHSWPINGLTRFARTVGSVVPSRDHSGNGCHEPGHITVCLPHRAQWQRAHQCMIQRHHRTMVPNIVSDLAKTSNHPYYQSHGFAPPGLQSLMDERSVRPENTSASTQAVGIKGLQRTFDF